MRLYSVVFDFYHNKWVIFNLFLIAMVFFQTQPKSNVFLINVPVWRLYWSDVCTSPKFVSVRRFYQSDLCNVRCLYCPTFVTSDFCNVRCLRVRRLYWYLNYFAHPIQIKVYGFLILYFIQSFKYIFFTWNLNPDKIVLN